MSGNNPVKTIQAALLRFVDERLAPTFEELSGELDQLNSALCDHLPGEDAELIKLAAAREVVPPLAWSVASVLTDVTERMLVEVERALRRAATLDEKGARMDWFKGQLEKRIIGMELHELIGEMCRIFPSDAEAEEPGQIQ